MDQIHKKQETEKLEAQEFVEQPPGAEARSWGIVFCLPGKPN